MAKQALALLKDQEGRLSESICVSTDVDKLMDCAQLEELKTSMAPLRDVGSYVPIESGDAVLHIEPTKIVE